MDRTSHHSRDRSRKSSQIPEVKIQIDEASRTSSAQNRVASSDGTLAENMTETPWSRETKPKIFHQKPPRKVRKVNQKLENSHHSFLTDVADMRSMETALVQLVNDFHSGKLQAFGRHCSTEQMEAIRDQQEKLARLHFDLGVQQDVVTPHMTDNMNELVSALEHLSQTIEQLHPNASQNQSDSN